MTVLSGDGDGDLLVMDSMSREPLLLRAEMRLEPAVQLLVDHGYSGAPVINDAGRLTGMLHAVDLAVMHLGPATDLTITRHTLAGEASRAAVTIHPADTMYAAAVVMRSHGTDRLAVVDEPDHVVGVLTGHDTLRTIIQHGDLLREVVDEQLAAIGMPDVRAAVDLSGVVLLTGAVDSYAARARVVRTIGAVNGVTEVDELLTVAP